LATYLVLAVPLALLWLGITNRITLESFVLGYLLGLAALFVMRPDPRTPIVWRRLPRQVLMLIIFVADLYWNIILSGIDLARRLLSRDMGLKPGIIAIPTQAENSKAMTALSAANLSLTPGEMAIEFDDTTTMYVHSLNVVATEETGNEVQARRIRMLKVILGRS